MILEICLLVKEVGGRLLLIDLAPSYWQAIGGSKDYIFEGPYTHTRVKLIN